jgi:hypothetical protein
MRFAAAALAVLAVPIVVALAHHSSRAASTPPAAFSWLKPAAAPSGWKTTMTPSGATLSYPAPWHTILSDRGTVSAAPIGERGVFRGYLNATPQSGKETLANWSRFRPAHVADEGGRDVRLVASASGLRFRTGTGSIVVDDYSTSKMRFREIAAIVHGKSGTTVIVAAAPVAHWAAQAPQLERAVSSFET